MRTWPAIDIELTAPSYGDLLQAFLLDHDLVAIEEDSTTIWRYFFRTTGSRDAAVAALSREWQTLAFNAVDIDDEDWVARSQASLRAVRVGRLTIAPPWDAETGTGEIIVVRPAMGFGTGHHATTRLCLDALQRLELAGHRVLDVGTGSGVLAIAASRLGAAAVHAIDHDPDALDAAREDLTLNPGDTVTFELADFWALTIVPVDLLLANLTGALLIEGAASLLRLVRPGGHLVLSGFPIESAAEVSGAFAAATVERQSSENEWACLTLYTAVKRV
jgi:ribosomal protein L11 methyltransferase